MTLSTACARAALCLAAAIAFAVPASAGAAPGRPGSGFEYDGPRPPRCDASDLRLRHFAGDGHVTGHEHLGHGHKWNGRNFKGYRTKPPCYLRRVDVPRAPVSTPRSGDKS